MESNKQQQCDYKFTLTNIDGIQYRFPVLNMNLKPFSGNFDSSMMKRAEMYKQTEPQVVPEKQKEVKKKNVQKNFTHFISIPVIDDTIGYNYDVLFSQIMELNPQGLKEQFFTPKSMLHLTLLMLDFTNDEEKLKKAKNVLRQLQPIIQQEYLGAVEGNQAKPLYLTFKGLQTFQYINPTQAKVLYCDIKRDDNYDILKKITSRIIIEFISKNIITKDDLSNVSFDYGTQLYDVKFHLTILKASGNLAFDAKAIIDKFGDQNFGVLKVEEIHLSNREFIDTFEGTRIKRNENGQNNDERGFYASDYKLVIGDEQFGY